MRHARAQPGPSETSAGLSMTITTTGYPPAASERHFVSVSKIGVLACGAGAPAATHGLPQLPLECWGIILECTEHATVRPSPWISLVYEETPPIRPVKCLFLVVQVSFLACGSLPLALDEPRPSPSSALSVH